MVDLGGGQDGPIEHGFSNSVFIVPGIIFVTLSAGEYFHLLQRVLLPQRGIQFINQKRMDKGDTMEMIKEMHKQVDSGEKFSPDSLEKLASLLNTLELSDEEKAELGQSLDDLVGKLKTFTGPNVGMGGMDLMGSGNLLMQITMGIAFIVMVTLFVFFGYKLYQSLTEKERKRDEKRKQKQMKKKK